MAVNQSKCTELPARFNPPLFFPKLTSSSLFKKSTLELSAINLMHSRQDRGGIYNLLWEFTWGSGCLFEKQSSFDSVHDFLFLTQINPIGELVKALLQSALQCNAVRAQWVIFPHLVSYKFSNSVQSPYILVLLLSKTRLTGICL